MGDKAGALPGALRWASRRSVSESRRSKCLPRRLCLCSIGFQPLCLFAMTGDASSSFLVVVGEAASPPLTCHNAPSTSSCDVHASCAMHSLDDWTQSFLFWSDNARWASSEGHKAMQHNTATDEERRRMKERGKWLRRLPACRPLLLACHGCPRPSDRRLNGLGAVGLRSLNDWNLVRYFAP